MFFFIWFCLFQFWFVLLGERMGVEEFICEHMPDYMYIKEAGNFGGLFLAHVKVYNIFRFKRFYFILWILKYLLEIWITFGS